MIGLEEVAFYQITFLTLMDEEKKEGTGTDAGENTANGEAGQADESAEDEAGEEGEESTT